MVQQLLGESYDESAVGETRSVSTAPMQRIADEVDARLREDYHLVEFYEEVGERRIRKKDIQIASEFIASNISED